MTAVTSKQIREAVATGLQSIVGEGEAFVEIANHTKSDFDGKWPVGTMTRGGAGPDRKMVANFSIYEATRYLEFSLLVLRGSSDSGAELTEQESEDALDAAADAFMGWVRANQSGTYWKDLTIIDRSEVLAVSTQKGDPYWLETFQLKVEVF